MTESVWKKTLGIFGFSSDEENELEQQVADDTRESYFSRRKKNLVSLSASKNAEIVVFEPTDYEEVQSIADNLKLKRAVIVNLHELQSEFAKRIVDFISGVVFAIDGRMQRVGDDIFLFAPSNVEVIPDKIEKKENSWLYK